MNAQSAPRGEAGETNAADPPRGASTAGPVPLSRISNENVNESERDGSVSPGVIVDEGVGDSAGGRDGTDVTIDAVAIGAAGDSVAVAVTVGVGVAVPASSRSVT